MSDVRALTVTAELVDYAVVHGSDVPGPVLDDLRAETAALGPPAGMQIGPDEGQLLTLLTRLVGARRAVEVGTFTGYSSLCIARGLAPGGALTCCDVSEEWTAIARRAWDRAGLADRIELRIAPALDTLRSLPAEPHIDLAFIDADKGGYVDYWDELCPACVPVGCFSPTTCCGRAASSSPRAPPRRTSPTTTPERFAPSTTMSPPTTGSTWRSCRRSMASPSPGAADGPVHGPRGQVTRRAAPPPGSTGPRRSRRCRGGRPTGGR